MWPPWFGEGIASLDAGRLEPTQRIREPADSRRGVSTRHIRSANIARRFRAAHQSCQIVTNKIRVHLAYPMWSRLHERTGRSGDRLSVSLLALSGVTKRYAADGPPAVDDLSFSLEPGRILALLGPSGCGKTTTLRLIAGFESPDAGQIAIAGRLVADGPGAGVPPEQRGVGLVFQDYALFPHLTVGDNVGFGLHGRGQASPPRPGARGPGARRPGRVRAPLSPRAVRRPAAARGRGPRPCPGPRAAPSRRALLQSRRGSPRPDARRGRGILRATGTTAVFVTHDQEEAFTIADVVGVLNHGRLEQIGSPERDLPSPRHAVRGRVRGRRRLHPGRRHPRRHRHGARRLRERQGLGDREVDQGHDPPRRRRLHPHGRGRRRDCPALLPRLRKPLLPAPAVWSSGPLFPALVRRLRARHPRPFPTPTCSTS